jgi:hypothetical protein
MRGAARSQTFILRSLPKGASFETRSCGALLRIRGPRRAAPALKMGGMR